MGHWLEIDGNRSHCQKRNMTYTVKYSKCQVGLCLNKDRNFFKDFYNSLLVFSHSFFPKNIPQAALTFCHFYYPYLTCCIIARNCKIGNFKKKFSEPNYILSSNNTKKLDKQLKYIFFDIRMIMCLRMSKQMQIFNFLFLN